MPMVAAQRPYILFVVPDDDPINPREEWDNFGTMVCFHKRYTLGDEHNYDDAEEFFRELVQDKTPVKAVISYVKDGNVDDLKLEYNKSEHTWELNAYSDYFKKCFTEYTLPAPLKGNETDMSEAILEQMQWQDLKVLAENTHCILPVYLYDHSGLTVNTTGFSCPWDSNRFYHWTSNSKGGAIDFVMKYSGKTFPEAVAQLIGESYDPYIRERIPYIKEEKGSLVLPEKAQNFKCAYWYLISVRGIEPEIVSHFMNAKMIYQEAKYGNCVFVGYDVDGTPKYCAMRSSSEKSSFKMDAVNSDKSYPFYNEGKSDLLIANESPIDLMSHATLAKIFYGKDWKEDHRISLGCLWDSALERYLQIHPEIKRIVFAVDNDYLSRDKDGAFVNWGQKAATRWCGKYGEKGYECAIHRPHLKDFNKDLSEMRKGRTPKDLDRQREVELQAEFEKDAVEEPPDEKEDEYER